jgi:geranylgeranyl pyrophosphate synthase
LKLEASVLELVAGDLASDGAMADLLDLPMSDVVDASGLPRIRPVLLALSARAVGGRPDAEAQHAAEALHLLLVAHDLALGKRGGRRRRVARRVIKRLGTNALTIRALELARHASHPEILGEVVDALREISDSRAIIDGSLRSGVESSARSASLSPEELWRVHADGRAGAVLAFCCRAGGHLGGGDAIAITALSRYGRHVGRLSHGAEDVAATAAGNAEHLVQRAYAGRPVLPIALASARDPAIGRRWTAFAADPQPDVAQALVELAVRSGGMRDAREHLARECWSAHRALIPVAPSPYRRGMERVASAFVRSEAA